MSLKDKLEIGLKPDAPYRPDNLPDAQQDDPDCQAAGTPGEAPEVEAAREACDTAEPAPPAGKLKKPRAKP